MGPINCDAKELLGNGLTTLSTIDRATGTLEVLTTGPGVSATVQNLEFDWDKAANLKIRRDHQANKREEFDYDGLYRLIQARLYATVGGGTASATDNNSYDAIGNLTNKGGAVGAHIYAGYNYGPRTGCSDTVIRPHAVYQVNAAGTTRRYCYDANGNVATVSRISGSGPIIYDATTWWVANLAKRISQGGTAAYSEFWYGPGRERIQQTAKKNAAVTETTLYVGGAYEKVTRGATTEHVHYIRGGGEASGTYQAPCRSLEAIENGPRNCFRKSARQSPTGLLDSRRCSRDQFIHQFWQRCRHRAAPCGRVPVPALNDVPAVVAAGAVNEHRHAHPPWR